MIFKKRGLIVSPKDERVPSWGTKRLMLPVPIVKDEVVRILLGFCDENNIGRIGYVDVDANDLGRIVAISENPILEPSKESFDCHGVVPTSVFNEYLFYGGFNRTSEFEYTMFEGLAIDTHRGYSSFVKIHTPFLAPTIDEELFRVGSFLYYENSKYYFFYIGGTDWVDVDKMSNKKKPIYNCKIIISDSLEGCMNGPSKQVIALDPKVEHGISRPWIIKRGEVYYMFYSVRHLDGGYRFEFAYSNDLLNWHRVGKFEGMDLSNKGWDSQMMCYPAFVSLKGRDYIIYCGNNNGEGGVGYSEIVNWDVSS